MVKVEKVAAWKINEDVFIEDLKEATRLVRMLTIRELLAERELDLNEEAPDEALADWVATNWDEIEARMKAAMGS